MDKVYKRKNLEMAWEKVKANRGSGGVDGQSLEALLNCGLCAERGAVRTSTTQVPPCTRGRWMNSSIMRVE